MARWFVVAVLALPALAAPSHAGTAAGSKAVAKQGVKVQLARGTLRITGNRKANRVTLRLERRKRGTLEVDVKSNGSADFAFKRRAFKRIVVRGGRGNDTLAISERNGSFFRSERTTLDGGRGNDRLVFTGTSAADSIVLSGSRRRLRLGRASRRAAGAASFKVAARSLERVSVTPLGGADTITLGELTGIGVREVALQLGSKSRGDGAVDRVAATATGGDDSVTAARDGSRLRLSGLGATVTAVNLESGTA